MNNQQFERLVHNLQDIMRCPHCSSSYVMEDIHYLGQLDAMTFLHMKCNKCRTPVFASVSLDNDGSMAVEDITTDDIAITDTPTPAMDPAEFGFEQRELEQASDVTPLQEISVEDGNLPPGDSPMADKLMDSLNPISYDSVLDMHEYLESFDGNFEQGLK